MTDENNDSRGTDAAPYNETALGRIRKAIADSREPGYTGLIMGETIERLMATIAARDSGEDLERLRRDARNAEGERDAALRLREQAHARAAREEQATLRALAELDEARAALKRIVEIARRDFQAREDDGDGPATICSICAMGLDEHDEDCLAGIAIAAIANKATGTNLRGTR